MRIPKLIHFVHFYESSVEFLYVHYMAIHSAVTLNEFTVYVHYQTLPYGQWYEKLRTNPSILWLKVAKIPTHIGKKEIIKIEHKVDWFKLHLLASVGGWCLDLDTICVKPFDVFSTDRFVICQEIVHGKIQGCCIAVMGSEPLNPFVLHWMQLYEQEFVPNGWGEASVMLPWNLYHKHYLDNDTATVVPCGYFLIPTWKETHKIYVDQCDAIPSYTHVLHLWNCEGWSKHYIQNIIKDETWAQNNTHTLYAKCVMAVEERMKRSLSAEKNETNDCEDVRIDVQSER